MDSPTAGAYGSRPHMAGWALTEFADTHDAVLDELVYDVCSRAMRSCGVRKHEVGLSITASMDVYDGRSISSGLTNSAAGGYLADSYRIEGDGAAAVSAAYDAVAAGDVDIALAVAVFNPETTTTAGDRGREFLAQLSNLAFDPHFDRPVGLFDEALLAMHATHAIESGAVSLDSMAAAAATAITRGSVARRGFRPAVTAADVSAAPSVCAPLTALMLPAVCAAAAAVLVMSPARAARARGRSLRLAGVGSGVGSTTSAGDWLTDPAAGAQRAAVAAYRSAGIADHPESLVVAEITSPTPALTDPIARALRLELPTLGDGFMPSGGVLSAYAGLTNGIVRLIELGEHLTEAPAGTRGIAHSSNTITGVALGGDAVFVGEVV